LSDQSDRLNRVAAVGDRRLDDLRDLRRAVLKQHRAMVADAVAAWSAEVETILREGGGDEEADEFRQHASASGSDDPDEAIRLAQTLTHLVQGYADRAES
jgi:hypothetical protein